MQFQVPQFIETEDKIVGPLTLKQFFYLGTAGAVVFTLFFIIESLVVWVVLSLPFVGAGFAFAFYKPYGRPLAHFLLAMVRHFISPQRYTWQPKEKTAARAAPREEEVRRMGLGELLTSVALKNTWRNLETRKKSETPKKQHERYEIFQGIGGQRQAARRIDYR